MKIKFLNTMSNLNDAASKHLNAFEKVTIPFAFLAVAVFIAPTLVAFAVAATAAWFLWKLFKNQTVFTGVLAAIGGLIIFRVALAFVDTGVGLLFGISAAGIASFFYRGLKKKRNEAVTEAAE